MMSFRFQKRIRVAPGIRVNLSKRGISTSVGRRGGTVSVGRRGVHGNVGLPGTGLSYRTKLNKKGSSKASSSTKASNQSASGANQEQIDVRWDDSIQDVRFYKGDGIALSEDESKAVRRAFKEDLTAIYEEKADEINERTARLLRLHQDAFDEEIPLEECMTEGIHDQPEAPSFQTFYDQRMADVTGTFSFFDRLLHLLPSKKQELHQIVNGDAQMQFTEAKTDYEETIRSLKEEQEHRQKLMTRVKEGDTEAMEEWSLIYLDELDFPLETDVDFHIPQPDTAYVDVDLPNPDKVPVKEAEVLKSGKLKITEKTQRDQRDHYARLAGGTALYLASYFFAYLPTVHCVVVSGYQQVLNEGTGHEDDVYIYSVKIDQDTFRSLNLDQVHPFSALEQFDHRINATKTFVLKEIDPFAPE
ncbi:DUF4236 domain-containing protein [Salisediminibacterium selenitireducens]|uniref:DUF4236 domain-containing protein n=1 Tax=Bacillus selenitireducens (strain ATCC 700615 / DSM 15326 / MLS10) TaxID=439292 RepID=D6XVJ8_BACIE|nr:DUF4236 domain-containing protein [Salisediminibacterium selenitireducens]ADH99736.1 hypothetical protein Bsel_2232 [[Bacillus] selenitireducens MLS10]